MFAAATAIGLSALSLGGSGEPLTEELGKSAQGRPIRATVIGDPQSPRRILVFGCIHGNECAGIAVTRRLVRSHALEGIAFWVVHNINPDGTRLGVRQNARGVDLNRNFGSHWRPIGRRWDPQYSGPRPWSEPETRLVRRLVLRVRPDITLWYHQPQSVVRAWGPSKAAARRFARLAGEPYRSIPWPNGTAPNWQNHRFSGKPAFVVELGSGRMTPAAAWRHAKAIRRL